MLKQRIYSKRYLTRSGTFALLATISAICLLTTDAEAAPGNETLGKPVVLQIQEQKLANDGVSKSENDNLATDSESSSNSEASLHGVDVSGVVRPGNCAHLEYFLNIIANVVETVSILCGGGLLILGAIIAAKGKGRTGRILAGCGIGSIVIGLATPGLINWLVATAADSGNSSWVWDLNDALGKYRKL